jgi:hypothetical protein
MGMTTPDARIVLRGDQIGLATDPIVDHPGQPADYIDTDGTVWTWLPRWRIVEGVQLRVYGLPVRIVLRGDQIGLATDPIVDHPGQPADYTHTDGTVWTWLRRWRIVGGGHPDAPPGQRVPGNHLRVYDLVVPGTESN